MQPLPNRPGHLVNLPVLNLFETQRFIDLVYPAEITGSLHVASVEDFTGRQFARNNVAGLTEYVRTLDARGCHSIYLRTTTDRLGLAQGRRGQAEDSVEIPGLWADIDFGTDGHADRVELPRPPDETAAAHIVTVSGLPAPTLWVHSGGGLYPWWLLYEAFNVSPDTQTYLATLAKRWNYILAAAARSQGWFYGTEASDLARVLRLPGSVNRKIGSRPRPCYVASDGGPRYLLQDLHYAADTAAQRWNITDITISAGPKAGSTETHAFYGKLTDPDGPPCKFMKIVQDRWVAAIQAAGPSCHTEGLKAALAVAMEAAKRHRGALTAMAAVQSAWLAIRRPGATTGHVIETADVEWSRLEQGAWSKAAAWGAAITDQTEVLQGDQFCHCGDGMPGPFVGGGTANRDADFWGSRPQLKHVHDFALSRRASPWATLGVVLTRVVATAPPKVVLPPLIGGTVSANLFLALVGFSGKGKGTAMRAAKEAVVLCSRSVIDDPEHYFDEHKLGTGQAIAHAYAYRDKEGVHRYADSALFLLDEIDHLTSHANQTGSTVLAELKCLYMGEKLGSFYVDPLKRIEIAEQTYRAGFIVGVQPTKSRVLLDDIDGGTPQRFVWLPTVYPHDEHKPEGPDPLRWKPPVWEPWLASRSTHEAGLPWAANTPDDTDQIIIPVAGIACAEIDKANWLQSNGKGDPLDGHRLLCQEKVAFALGVLDGRVEVSGEDWQLAAHFMALSDTTRAQVVDALAQESAKANTTRGRAEATRAVLVDDAREEAAVKRVAKSVRRLLDHHGWTRHAELRRKVTSADRGRFDEAVVHLVKSGGVEAEKINYQGQEGLQYRLPQM